MVLIPVTVVIVLVLFWWAATRAYCTFSDTLVSLTIYLIVLSLWGAGLLVHGIDGLGLDLSVFPGWFIEVYSQVAPPSAGSSDEASARGISCARTMSTDSLDSLWTVDTVTTINETPESAHLVPVASKPPSKSVQLSEAQLESSDSMSASSDSLFESGSVREPTYWKCSKERTCWEVFSLSSQALEEIEEIELLG